MPTKFYPAISSFAAESSDEIQLYEQVSLWQILKLYQSGAIEGMKKENFEEIYRIHQHAVFNLCLHYLQNQQEAEEATQDIFVKIYFNIGTFEGKSSLKTWLYRIVINHCLDLLRNRKRRNRLAVITHMFLGKSDTPIEVPHFDHPGVLLEDRESLEFLFKQINQLPDNQRTAIILKYLDDLSQQEITSIMALSEKAVESLLQRGKQNLRARLKK